jgi:hypothetical protein
MPIDTKSGFRLVRQISCSLKLYARLSVCNEVIQGSGSDLGPVSWTYKYWSLIRLEMRRQLLSLTEGYVHLPSIMVAQLLTLGFLLLTSVNAAPQASPVSSLMSVTSAAPSAVPSLTTEERDELFSLHEELINIPSISGEETECADYISDYLEELGYYVEKVPVGNTRTSNVWAYPKALKDEGVWPEVLITSHIDTVRIQEHVSQTYCCSLI